MLLPPLLLLVLALHVSLLLNPVGHQGHWPHQSHPAAATATEAVLCSMVSLL
jgi:hypothetical protein